MSQNIEINSQIIFNRPNCLIICRVTEVREKSVKVDYANEPISCNTPAVTVYSYSCWLPKSVIISDAHGSLTTKKWFENQFAGGYRIKPYFIKDGAKVTV